MEKINIGSHPNDKSGDTIRDAFDKVNKNFEEVKSTKVFVDFYVNENMELVYTSNETDLDFEINDNKELVLKVK